MAPPPVRVSERATHKEDAMALNPLEETGIPVEEQLRNWSELNVQPYDKTKVDPYTRCRVILMNGIEVESIIFSHQFARHTDNMEIKRALALSRRVDQQQQKAVNGLNPGDQNPLETTIGYEQVAVDPLPGWPATNRIRCSSRRWTSRCWRTSIICTATPTCTSCCTARTRPS
jgi:hypothetical protein